MNSKDFLIEASLLVYDVANPYTTAVKFPVPDDFSSYSKDEKEELYAEFRDQYRDETETDLADDQIGIKSYANRSLQSVDQAKPTDFSKFSDIAKNTFAQNKFYIQVKGVDKSRQEYPLDKSKDTKAQIAAATKEFLAYQKNVYNKRLVTKDLEVITSNLSPTEKNNRLDTNNLLPTAKQNITTYVNNSVIEKLAKSHTTITLQNIRQLTKQSKLNGYKGQQSMYDNLFSHFIDNPGQKEYPLTIIDDLATLTTNNNFYTQASIAADFGEVLGPIALLTNNLNGNANRIILDFLKAKSYDELKTATIHFNPNTNDPLVDSYVEYQGNIVSISSKAQGGAGAGAKGLFNALNEIKQNPEALKLFNKEILRNPEYKKAYDLLALIANDDDISWKIKFDALKMVSPTSITDADIATIEKLYQLSKPQLSQSIQQLMTTSNKNSFSPGFKKMYESFTQRSKAGKNAWGKLLKATIFTTTSIINRNPIYSNLCTWIFNHGAIIQVDMIHNMAKVPNITDDEPELAEAAAQKTIPFIINNFIGTWPSNRTETVEFVEEPAGDGLSIRLTVNKHKDQFGKNAASAPNLTEPEYKKTDTRNPQDSIKNQADWFDLGKYYSGTMKTGKTNTTSHALDLGSANWKAYEIAGTGITDEQLAQSKDKQGRGIPPNIISQIKAARKDIFTLLSNPAKYAADSATYDTSQSNLKTHDKMLWEKKKKDAIITAARNLQQIRKTNPSLYAALAQEKSKAVTNPASKTTAQPTIQTKPPANSVSPQQETIRQVYAHLTPAQRIKFGNDVRDEAENGESAENILELIRTNQLSESNIMRGLKMVGV
jgi:hypothetical protein